MVSKVFVSSSSTSVFSTIQRRMCSFSWKLGLLIVILAIIGCQSQTFQYSRGWTNGKRSGNSFPANQQSQSQVGASSPARTGAGAAGAAMYEDGPIIGIPLDEPTVPISTAGGIYRIFSNGVNRPEGKLRSIDYSQFLTRKLGNGSNPNRKPPMWIVGVDQENNNSNSNNNAGSSDDF